MRGNHDDKALSAYHKFKQSGREVQLILAQSNPVLCSSSAANTHSCACLACLHARALLCLCTSIFADSNLRCVNAYARVGRRGGRRGVKRKRGTAKKHGKPNTMNI